MALIRKLTARLSRPFGFLRSQVSGTSTWISFFSETHGRTDTQPNTGIYSHKMRSVRQRPECELLAKSHSKLSHRVLGANCNTFDVVVGVIHTVDESGAFVHFVGMLVGSCFKARGYRHAHKCVKVRLSRTLSITTTTTSISIATNTQNAMT